MSTLNVDRIVDASGGVLAPISSVFRSRIINGAMVIDQRNAGASVTGNDAVFPVDRFKFACSQSSKLTAQQNQGSVTPPVGFANYLGCTSSSAYTVGSGDFFALVQPIEAFNTADLNWGTANAKTVTLSFWVRSSLTGTFGGSLANGGADYSYPFTYSIPVANTWTQISITIAGPTAGTWLGATNGIGIRVYFGLGVGSTLSGTASAWAGSLFFAPTGATSVVGTNGATFYITGVQLERGTQATSFEYRQYGQELALCQRYFQIFYGSASGTPILARNNAAAANQGPALNIWLKTSMRSAPTGTILGTWGVTNCGQPVFSYTGTEVATLYSNSTTSGDCLFLANASTAGASMSSEL